MALTFGDVRKTVAQYANRGGQCASADGVKIFARQVMEHLLHYGAYGSIRKFCFIAKHGCIALPPELETPLQVRIGNRVGTVWTKWFTFQTINCELEGCLPAGNVLMEEPNMTPIIFDLPPSGSIVGVLGTCCEKEDAFLIVQGKDITGRDVVTYNDKGEQINGEYFKVRKNELRYGKVTFGEITGVVKSLTTGYVQIYAVNPQTKSQLFLGDYSPLEEKPLYKKVRVVSPRCGDFTEVTVIGRIRLKENYTDNDIVPFDSTLTIELAAQRIQAELNNDIQIAAYKTQSLQQYIENEAAYKRVSPGAPINVFHPLTGGAIKNIVY